jgi:hypothetical protein
MWNPGDRVHHQSFGSGTVLACNDKHTVIHFDQGGPRRFATSFVVLTPNPRLDPRQRANLPYPTPTPVHAPVEAGAAVAPEQLMDLARRKVRDEESLNEFVYAMWRMLPGPSHEYVGVTSGMRVQQFQNWLYDVNPQHRLTDAQLLAVLRVEFPLASAELFTGDVGTGLRHISSMRDDYNRDGHNGPSPTSRGMPLSVSYGRF